MIKIIREPSKDNLSTFGVMFVNGYFHSFTLENTELIIPTGKYEFELYNSPKNKRVVPLLKNVPNRSMIEIHIANYEYELEGCIAVGETRGLDAVYNSKNAFNSLMLKINQLPKSEYKIKIIEVEKL